MAYGVIPEGFAIKPLTQIKADIEARQLAAPEIGPAQDQSTHSFLGQLNTTIAAELAEVWELADGVYASADPEGAIGVALDNVASLTGASRRASAPTRVTCLLTVAPGPAVPAGSIASIVGRPDLKFALEADVINDTLLTDDFEGVFVCLQDGPIACNAGTLTVIETSVTEWEAVTNPTDGVLGRNADSAQQLRERRSLSLARPGGSTVSAIRAALLDFDTTPEFETIESVSVVENTTDATDANGLPPHSFEVILDDGEVPSVEDDLIAQAIYDTKPAGIPAQGLESGDAVDVNGETHPTAFSRVERLEVYIDLEITTGAGFPLDGEEQIAAAIVAKGDTLRDGQQVIAEALKAQCFSVVGVTDVPTFRLGYSASPPDDDNLAVGHRQRATFDTTRVTFL